MKLTVAVPTLIGVEKYMHMHQYQWKYRGLWTLMHCQAKAIWPNVQRQIMTAVSTPSYIICNRKTPQQ